ncbi:MAG: BlaI/MecI/CopY family transcriptional regulator [Pyrinomonadaceae bacterium]
MYTPKFRLRGFQRLSDAVTSSLGELEQKALREVRRRGETNVAGICSAFDESYAYTTVMTTLDRLYKKGLLERRKEGRAFFYAAKYSQEELERGMAADVIDRLLGNSISIGRVEPVLACIVDSVSERDRFLLDELERLVKEKRRELEKES